LITLRYCIWNCWY